MRLPANAKERSAALVRAVGFKESEKASGAINAWTAERTHDRILEVIPPGLLTGETKLVFVDTVHFEAGFDDPSQPANTKQLAESEAATAVVMVRSATEARLVDRIRFDADHPFLFFIRQPAPCCSRVASRIRRGDPHYHTNGTSRFERAR